MRHKTDDNNNNNNHDDTYSAIIYGASRIKEFTVVPLGQSRSASGGRQLVGQAANLTSESACRLLYKPNIRPSPLVLLLNIADYFKCISQRTLTSEKENTGKYNSRKEKRTKRANNIISLSEAFYLQFNFGNVAAAGNNFFS